MLGEAPVLEDKHVAVLQRQRLGKIDQDLVATDERDDLAADMALVMGKHGDVEGSGACGRLHPGAFTDTARSMSAAVLTSSRTVVRTRRLSKRDAAQAIVSNRRRIHEIW